MIPDCDGAIDSDRMILEVQSYASTGWAANHLHLITCGSVRQASGLSRIAGRTRPTLGLGAGRAPRCEHAVSATTASAEIETGGFTGMGVRTKGIDVVVSDGGGYIIPKVKRECTCSTAMRVQIISTDQRCSTANDTVDLFIHH